ncbi:hypothetical protein ACFOWX_08320 [Sphingorhabdus arenilitoris]|uniref:Lipoprotein n=1 Tax=Sphingorhabdus arenilitoris TaxID=1490041 RepID=A0ABV8RGN3_9SPHN
MNHWAMRLGAILMLFGLFGCNEELQDKLAIVKGQSYLIPWQDRPVINNRTRGTYVRISQKEITGGTKIQLKVDPRWYEFQVNNNYPSLFGYGGKNISVNGDFVKIDTIIGRVLCEKPYNEYTKYVSCGFRLLDEEVSWSVNFSSKDIDQVEHIKSEAEKILKSYREAANVK